MAKPRQPLPLQPLPETSARMRAVRRRDTKPELAVRRMLHAHGVRFRVFAPELPGRPDIVNRAQGWCIFVHGCYWHGHRGCALATVPRTNTAFWLEKLAANRARDARKERELRSLGFRVEVIWQCEIRREELIARRLQGILRRPKRQLRAG